MSDKPTPTGKQRLAQLQAEQARKSRQNKLLVILSACVVVVLVAVGVAWAVSSGNKKKADAAASQNAKNNAFIKTVTSIPASSFDTVGKGTANAAPQPMKSPKPETQNGKPVVTYVGGEFCPFCGMERWSLVSALSRFGTFSGLQSEVSSSTDNPANIPTMTFLHSSYTSKYLVFNPYEIYDRQQQPLQKLPSKMATIMKQENPNGGIPWIDYGGVDTGGLSYDGSELSNHSGEWVAQQLKNPKSQVAQGILGGANVVTSELCQLTKGQPANVCKSKGVLQAAGVGQ